MPRSAARVRRAHRLTRSAAGMVLLVALAFGWSAAPVQAHTALLQASPGPDQTVGGNVDAIDLAFLEPVTNATVTVSFNGQPVAGTTTLTDGELIRFEFETPLEADGRYQLFYELISFDSDYTTSGYFFTYAADAPQAAKITLPDGTDGSGSNFPVVASLVAFTALIAALGVFVWRLDSDRQEELEPDEAYDW